jgi:hypothetical protein
VQRGEQDGQVRYRRGHGAHASMLRSTSPKILKGVLRKP